MKLNYKVFGEGPPLIILHGLFGSLDNWQTLAKRFSQHFQVYIVDQRNHGKSPHSGQMNYQLMAEDLLKLLDDHEILKAHLIGHSMGGKTVMQFAAENPGRVNNLIVVDMGPWASEPGHDEIFEALKSLNVDGLESRQEADQQMGKVIENQAIRLFLLKNLIRTKEGFSWKMNLPAIEKNYENILSEVNFSWPYSQPALFISGAESDYIKGEDLPQIESVFSDVSIATIEGAGHWVHAEAPDAFFKTVINFLRGQKEK